MAEAIGAAVTNHFKVKDIDEFNLEMSNLPEIAVEEVVEESGEKRVFLFAIDGFFPLPDEETPDLFEIIGKHLPAGETATVQEVIIHDPSSLSAQVSVIGAGGTFLQRNLVEVAEQLVPELNAKISLEYASSETLDGATPDLNEAQDDRR